MLFWKTASFTASLYDGFIFPLGIPPHPGDNVESAMDKITFRMDTVLSDVHLLLPNARHLMTRLNGVGQPGSWTILMPFLTSPFIEEAS